MSGVLMCDTCGSLFGQYVKGYDTYIKRHTPTSDEPWTECHFHICQQCRFQGDAVAPRLSIETKKN